MLCWEEEDPGQAESSLKATQQVRGSSRSLHRLLRAQLPVPGLCPLAEGAALSFNFQMVCWCRGWHSLCGTDRRFEALGGTGALPGTELYASPAQITRRCLCVPPEQRGISSCHPSPGAGPTQALASARLPGSQVLRARGPVKAWHAAGAQDVLVGQGPGCFLWPQGPREALLCWHVRGGLAF